MDTSEIYTEQGENLSELSKKKKLLLVFLRHFGCTFCRETMADLANLRRQIDSAGMKLILVHMGSPKLADEVFGIYGLDRVSHVPDAMQSVYKRFGLKRAELSSFVGLKIWWRMIVAGIWKGHWIGRPAGDPYQMPGVFLFHKNRILNTFTYKNVSDRPDFERLIRNFELPSGL